MKKFIVICDHCGKPFNNGVEQLEVPFYIKGWGSYVDLCEKCKTDFEKLIADFVTKHKEEQNE